MPRAADLKDQKFEWLTVVRYHESRPGSGRIWECRCRCGKEGVFVAAKNLLRGRQVSCGCWRRTVGAQIVAYKLFKNLKGKKFGRLKPREVVGRYQRQSLWECKCKCGNIVRVPVSSLTSGATKSCGCLRSEKTRELDFRRWSRGVWKRKRRGQTVLEERAARRAKGLCWKCGAAVSELNVRGERMKTCRACLAGLYRQPSRVRRSSGLVRREEAARAA